MDPPSRSARTPLSGSHVVGLGLLLFQISRSSFQALLFRLPDDEVLSGVRNLSTGVRSVCFPTSTAVFRWPSTSTVLSLLGRWIFQGYPASAARDAVEDAPTDPGDRLGGLATYHRMALSRVRAGCMSIAPETLRATITAEASSIMRRTFRGIDRHTSFSRRIRSCSAAVRSQVNRIPRAAAMGTNLSQKRLAFSTGTP